MPPSVPTDAPRAGPARRHGDRVHHVGAALVLVTAPLLVMITLLATTLGPARAAGEAPGVVIADDAPLARLLVALAAREGHRARVDDRVTDRVGGTFAGDTEELIALLVDTHDLELYREGETLWFDRIGRNVVDFVRLEEPDIVRALGALAAPVAPGGTVQVEASGRGLVLSGSRRYVRTSLARIALATGRAVEPVPAADDAGAVPGEAGARPSLDGAPALVATGEGGFVELADGTRLVVGSELADGRRLAAIERGRLVFERDGRETVLALR